MEQIKIEEQTTTLVDVVEHQSLNILRITL